MEERTVTLRIRGMDRLYVDPERGFQLFVLERAKVAEILKQHYPLGYRRGQTIDGVKKRDPAANNQEIVATITSSDEQADERIEKFHAAVKEFVKMVSDMDLITITLPTVDVIAIFILVD